MHSDDDQVEPIADSAMLSSKIVKNSLPKVYPSYPNGMPQTHKDVINADLLAFVQGTEQATTRAA
jgi:non-heme chloroperoxidase